MANRRPGRVHGAAVRNPKIAYDLRFLLAVLNWATVARERCIVLLERNAFKGLPRPVEMSPRRPLVTQEQYQGLLPVTGEVSPLLRLRADARRLSSSRSHPRCRQRAARESNTKPAD